MQNIFRPLNTPRRATPPKPSRESDPTPARIHAARRRGPATCRGAMLLILMFLIAFMGITLAVAADLWQIAAVREKEAQLLFVGGEYQRALAGYKAATPPGLPTSPERLEQLLLDERQQVPLRHLRRMYRDPITDSTEWGLIKEGGRIAGVFSLGSGVPFKQAGFPRWATDFAKAGSYAKWQFLAGTTAALVEATSDPSFTASPAAPAATPIGAALPSAVAPPAIAEAEAVCTDTFNATFEACKDSYRGLALVHCRNAALADYRSCQRR